MPRIRPYTIVSSYFVYCTHCFSTRIASRAHLATTAYTYMTPGGEGIDPIWAYTNLQTPF